MTYLPNCETKSYIIVVIFWVHLGKGLLINEAITISFSVLDCPAIKSCYNSEHRKSSRNHSWHPRTLLCSWQNELTQCPVLRWEQKCCFKGISQYVSWNLCLPISSYKHTFNKAHKSCPTALGSCKGEMNPLVLMSQCKSPIPLQKACRETKTIHVLASRDRSYCTVIIFHIRLPGIQCFYRYLPNPPSQDTWCLERNLSVKFSIIKGLKYVFICYFLTILSLQLTKKMGSELAKAGLF